MIEDFCPRRGTKLSSKWDSIGNVHPSNLIERHTVLSRLAAAPRSLGSALRKSVAIFRMSGHSHHESVSDEIETDAATAKEFERVERAARLLQSYYSYQRWRHRKLRGQCMLSAGSLRFWSHIQHGLRYRPAKFVRVASDSRKLCRPVREQADAVTRWFPALSALVVGKRSILCTLFVRHCSEDSAVSGDVASSFEGESLFRTRHGTRGRCSDLNLSLVPQGDSPRGGHCSILPTLIPVTCLVTEGSGA